MALTIGDIWITSDRCPQVAMSVPGRGWVLSWRPGCCDRQQAIAAMIRAECGDLATDPAASPPAS
jgi:hypothetical protein